MTSTSSNMKPGRLATWIVGAVVLLSGIIVGVNYDRIRVTYYVHQLEKGVQDPSGKKTVFVYGNSVYLPDYGDEAALELYSMGEKAHSELFKLLTHEEFFVRSAAVQILSRTGISKGQLKERMGEAFPEPWEDYKLYIPFPDDPD